VQPPSLVKASVTQHKVQVISHAGNGSGNQLLSTCIPNGGESLSRTDPMSWLRIAPGPNKYSTRVREPGSARALLKTGSRPSRSAAVRPFKTPIVSFASRSRRAHFQHSTLRRDECTKESGLPPFRTRSQSKPEVIARDETSRARNLTMYSTILSPRLINDFTRKRARMHLNGCHDGSHRSCDKVARSFQFGRSRCRHLTRDPRSHHPRRAQLPLVVPPVMYRRDKRRAPNAVDTRSWTVTTAGSVA